MKVTVFGATGRTGRSVVDEALGAGHEGVAFARNPDAVETHHERLRVAKGDILDPAAVAAAVQGQDAVLFVLGETHTSKTTLISTGMGNVVRAMEEQGVRRLVSLGVIGAGDSRKECNFVFRKIILPLFLKHVVEDHERAEAIVQQSNLEWTIVRAPRLADGPSTGSYRVSLNAGQVGQQIARADVAELMVKQLQDPQYVRKTPAIGV